MLYCGSVYKTNGTVTSGVAGEYDVISVFSIASGTAATAPPPFRPGEPALWEPFPNHPMLV